MRTLLSRSMFWKLFAPICALLLLSALAAAVLLPLVIQRTAEQEAIVASQETVRQFQVLRKYYTDNVVSKVMTDGKVISVGAVLPGICAVVTTRSMSLM